jgi:hypothetical protein
MYIYSKQSGVYCTYWNFNYIFRLSKGRTWAIVTIVTVALIVSVGVGLGVGFTRQTGDGSSSSSNQDKATLSTPAPATTTVSPLYNPPSSTREGRYRFAAVTADHEDCSKIGK